MEEKYNFRRAGEKGEGSAYSSEEIEQMKEERKAKEREWKEEDSHRIALWQFMGRTGQIR